MTIERQYIGQFLNEAENPKQNSTGSKIVEAQEIAGKDAIGRNVYAGDYVVRFGASASGRPTIGKIARVVGTVPTTFDPDLTKVKLVNQDGRKVTAEDLHNYILLSDRDVLPIKLQ